MSSLTPSLFALNQIQRTNKALARAINRLASGQRITSARDGMADLSISNRLNAQFRAIQQAVQNINQTQGYLATAEGAMATQLDLVQRMRELAIQASSGIVTDLERAALNLEFQALYSEFSRITDQTEFNGTKLLDGSFGTKQIQVGANAQDRFGVYLPSMDPSAVFTQPETSANGSVQFTSNIVLPTFGQSLMPMVGDLNNDGHLDIVNLQYTTALIAVQLGRGDGTFSTPSTFPSININALAGTLGDVNGDGNLDIVTGDGANNTVSVYIGNGDGTFQSRVTYATLSTNIRDVALADIDEDGDLDIIGNETQNNQWSIYLNNGNGTFAPYYSVASTFIGFGVEMYDMNNDGHLDIVSASWFSNTLHVQLGNGNGTFAARNTISTGNAPRDPRVGDVNNDGIKDVVVSDTNDGTFSVFIGKGDGTFNSRVTYRSSGTDTRDLKLVDLNEDGNLDIISPNYTNGYYTINWGHGDGSFSGPINFGSSTNPYYLESGDFNEDGVTDVVVSNFSSANDISVVMMTPKAQNFSKTPSITTQSKAESAIEILDNAIKYINASQAQVGAVHSRLSSSENIASLMAENLASAKSSIADTDYAIEVAEFVRLQILQSAQVSVLAQANINRSLALKLLENLELPKKK